MREKLLEFRIELACQCLVVRKDQRRFVHPRDDIGDREGLSRAGRAEQHLLLLPAADALHQLVDGLGLIALRRIG